MASMRDPAHTEGTFTPVRPRAGGLRQLGFLVCKEPNRLGEMLNSFGVAPAA
jgi:hypothetical protein